MHADELSGHAPLVDRSLFVLPDGTFDGVRAVPNEAVTKLMLSLADLKPGEKVLEIGTGSGYQTQAILEAVGEPHWNVCTVEKETAWMQGERNYAQFDRGTCFLPGMKICSGLQGDGKFGWPFFIHAKEHKLPLEYFDAIIVSCGMSSIPPAYEEQLREGGRLVIPLGKPDGQELLRLEKRNGKLVLGRVGGYCRFQMCS